MQEVVKLLLLLGIAAVCNIVGGVYVNINVNKLQFSLRALITGIIKAACIATMFIGLAYIIENMPNLAASLGVEPKAMLISAIAIYTTKVVGHLTTIFGFKKEQISVAAVKETEEFVDM